MKLHEALAVIKTVNADANQLFTAGHRASQHKDGLAGLKRTYEPLKDDGEKFPPESKTVQVRIPDVMTDVAAALTRMFDAQATIHVGNTDAQADIVIDGEVILADVPLDFLLFLEKKLVDVYTYVTQLPTLDPAEAWTFDEATATWVTEPVRTARSKKEPRVLVKAEATDRHPAQVDVWQEDVLVGYWTTQKLSGALPVTEVRKLRARVVALQAAVKAARQRANSVEVAQENVGAQIFDYLFARTA
jgi:hypothetical protein